MLPRVWKQAGAYVQHSRELWIPLPTLSELLKVWALGEGDGQGCVRVSTHPIVSALRMVLALEGDVQLHCTKQLTGLPKAPQRVLGLVDDGVQRQRHTIEQILVLLMERVVVQGNSAPSIQTQIRGLWVSLWEPCCRRL